MTTTELKTNLLASTVNEVETACKSLSLEELATLLKRSEKMMQDEYFARPQNLWDEQVETGAVIPELESWYELNAYNDAIYHVFCERVEASAIPPPN